MGKLGEKVEDILFNLRKNYTVFEWLHDFYYWFKDNFISPYNVIRIKTLNRRYHEYDEVMLHGIFQILVDYVKTCNESPYFKILVRTEEEIDKEMECYKNYDEETKKQFRASIDEDNRVMQEVYDLYTWWTVWRPGRPDINGIDDVDIKEWMENEKAFAEEDLNMTIRLMKIRTCLWT